jgi:hypothetical protein
MPQASRNPQRAADDAFKRVIGYFLDHEKPKDKGKPKPRKRKPVSKKPSTKAKKRA